MVPRTCQSVFRIDENKLDKLIGKPWAVDGKNFSSRVWQSKTSMVNELHSELIRTCITGKSPDDAIKHMTKFVDKKFKNAKAQAGRLVMTEQAYFASVAQKDAFNELDVEEFEIVATLDSRTSETCRDLDGQHFPVKDYQAGVTAPPFHVWCRSTTVPCFEDNYGGERSARGRDGKTYYVPDNMTYREWEKKFVNDAISDEDIKLFEKYKSILGSNAPINIEDFMKIKYNHSEWDLFKSYSNSIKIGEMTSLIDFTTYMNVNDEINSVLIGKITANGIEITSKSNHYIARTIGSIEGRRNGVSPLVALDALRNPVEIYPVKTLVNGRSQRFRRI